MAGNIANATRNLYELYDSIRAKCKAEIGDAFWDLVVITASDELQKNAYEKQIENKLKKKEIPSGIPYLVYADPPGPRAGCGGSTMYVISELEKKYGWDLLNSYRILLLNAGGLSQRLPSASVLGKIFSALPVGKPMYQMLDVKLISYLPFLKRMAPGFFHAACDTIEVFDIGDGNNTNWDCKQPGFTALAHPSPLKIGTGHGVYVLKDKNNSSKKNLVEQRVCLEVLQKPSIKKMYDKEAVIKKSEKNNPTDDFVYTDSCFFFDHDIALKLLKFYREEAPLGCEIDAYGDFLQALGPKATISYTSDTANVGKIEPNLVEMRKKIFNLLKGTPLTVLALNASQFHHFGTVVECLDHFSHTDSLSEQMGFEKWICSKRNDFTEDSSGPTPAKQIKVDGKKVFDGCVMQSNIHKNSVLDTRCMLEYCHFEVPITVGSDCLISNCELLMKDQIKVEIPANTFLHTVPVNHKDAVMFATILFASDDNLKKTQSPDKSSELIYYGVTVSDAVRLLCISSDDNMFTNSKSARPSLWTLKLFPLQPSMSQSFLIATNMINAIKSKEKFDLSGEERISMADILETKDIEEMLSFRNKLADLID